jgi:cbb3-type cytochrome oxidase subunit 3
MTRLLQISAMLTLLGLVLMVWSMIAPTPMPVILAMSVGQLFGTLAFGMFGYAVLVDQLRKQRAKGAVAAAAAAAAVASIAQAAGEAAATSAGPAGSAPAGSAPAGEAPP